jgi:hypothetical protein
MESQNPKSVEPVIIRSAQAYIRFRITATEELKPPILKTNPSTAVTPISSSFGLVQAATAFRRNQASQPIEEPPTRLTLELKTPRLNDVHHHLWLAGRPTTARPLHRQKLLGRTILITEDPDEHLVWFEHQIFVKPLPNFLLDWESWNSHLCSDRELHKAACGLLLSYAWLVRHKSDLDIAKETGLLSKEIDWSSWVEFIDAFLDNINCETLSDVNQRYEYGELRLSRLNAIYRLAPPMYSFANLIRGYQIRSTWYQAFFDHYFKWMLAVFAILSVVLSALQVGLATTTLQGSGLFQGVSYGMAIAALVAVEASLAVVFFVWLSLFFYHLLVTRINDRAVYHRRLVARSA